MITEPSTMITDYILAISTFYLAIKLLSYSDDHPANLQEGLVTYMIAFVFFGIAAFTGGTYHGFHNPNNLDKLSILWKLTLALLVISNLLLILSTIRIYMNSTKLSNVLYIVSFVKMILFLLYSQNISQFPVIMIDFGISLVMITLIRIRAATNQKFKWFVICVIILIITGILFALKIGFHQYFNHRDLGHFLLILAMNCLYLDFIENNFS